MAMLCLIFTTHAQSAKSVEALKIGDQIPESILKHPLAIAGHPDGKPFITLNEYKDQLVILDFWATYCKPCIRSILKLDSIRKELKNQFSVLPIQVYDAPDRISPYFKMSGKNWPSVVKDTLLNKVVFSRYITGFGTVWIYKGKLIAVPYPSSISSANISKVLAGEVPELTNLKEQPK